MSDFSDSHCQECELRSLRSEAFVPFRGDPKSPLMIVGESPGKVEVQKKMPFVGPSGQILDKYLRVLGMGDLIDGDRIYFTNLVKCRPPGNKIPSANPVLYCEDSLKREIVKVNPKVILALGRIVCSWFSGFRTSTVFMGDLHGKVIPYTIKTDLEMLDFPVVASYHPSFLLRGSITPSTFCQSIQLAKTILDKETKHEEELGNEGDSNTPRRDEGRDEGNDLRYGGSIPGSSPEPQPATSEGSCSGDAGGAQEGSSCPLHKEG